MTISDLYAAAAFHAGVKKARAEGLETDQRFNHLLYGALSTRPANELTEKQDAYVSEVRKYMLAARTGVPTIAIRRSIESSEDIILAAHRRIFSIDFGGEEKGLEAIDRGFCKHVERTCEGLYAAASYCKGTFGDPWLGRPYVEALFWPCELVALEYIRGLF